MNNDHHWYLEENGDPTNLTCKYCNKLQDEIGEPRQECQKHDLIVRENRTVECCNCDCDMKWWPVNDAHGTALV